MACILDTLQAHKSDKSNKSNKSDKSESSFSYILRKPTGSKDSQTICDECYKMYPFYYGGAHGSDFYKYSNLSLSFRELSLFTERYPSAIVGYVLNRATYASGNGTHWLSMSMKDKTVYLVDSGGRDGGFTDNGELSNEIASRGYAREYNPISIQTDDHNCGMFSCLSLYLMLCYDCNIKKTIEAIGVDAKNLVDGKDIDSFTSILAHPISMK